MSATRAWTGFVLRRLGQFAFVILATYTLTFALIHFLPGDPLVSALAAKGGSGTVIDPAELDELRVRYGLDGSLWEQYARHLVDLARGDLGTSISTGAPVSEMIARALPYSARIGGLALLLGVLGAVVITYLAYVAPKKWMHRALLQIPPFGVAIPAFLSGLVLISIFAFTLGWLPSSGTRAPGSIILPSITLALPVGAMFFQVFSAAIFEAGSSQFTFIAVAKGVPPHRIFVKHLLRNAALPSITIIGLAIGYLAGGTAVVETVFARDGIGTMTVDAVLARDINVIQGVVLMVGAVYAGANLVVDILYGVIDPRIQIGGGGGRQKPPRDAAAVAGTVETERRQP
ncbi:ABC transporter permease [Georgenia sp. H159]|uniref:ABC transporter permease n=1 Tax=Georgenia sp. H159 TaxID=3076115 RepID=UPI002D778073|nr:ABC transporter permease [Georgenia sp. H159]